MKLLLSCRTLIKDSFEVLFDACLAYELIRYFSQQSNPDLHVLNNQKTSKTIECQIRGRHINECLNTSNLLSGFPSCHVPNSTMDFLHLKSGNGGPLALLLAVRGLVS